MGRKMAPEHNTSACSACSGTCTCKKERRADQPQGLVPTPDFWLARREAQKHMISEAGHQALGITALQALRSLSISFGIRNTPSDIEEIACPMLVDSTEIAEIAVDTDGSGTLIAAR